MGVMTFDAIASSPVSLTVYAKQCSPVAVWIFEVGMTSVAEFSGSIQRKIFVYVGMIDRRPMAVFTFNSVMG